MIDELLELRTILFQKTLNVSTNRSLSPKKKMKTNVDTIYL